MSLNAKWEIVLIIYLSNAQILVSHQVNPSKKLSLSFPLRSWSRYKTILAGFDCYIEQVIYFQLLLNLKRIIC